MKWHSYTRKNSCYFSAAWINHKVAMLLLQHWIQIGMFFKVIAREWHSVCNLPFKHTYNTNPYNTYSDQLSPLTHMDIHFTYCTYGCVLNTTDEAACSKGLCPGCCLFTLALSAVCKHVHVCVNRAHHVVHLRTGCCLFSLHVPDWQLCVSYKNGWTSLSTVLVVVFFRCAFLWFKSLAFYLTTLIH